MIARKPLASTRFRYEGLRIPGVARCTLYSLQYHVNEHEPARGAKTNCKLPGLGLGMGMGLVETADQMAR